MQGREREIGQAILEQHAALTQAVTACLEERRETDRSRDQVRADVGMHLQHLAQAFAVRCPPLFVDHVRWAQAHAAGRTMPEDDLRLTLRCLRATLRTALPSYMHHALDAYFHEGEAQLFGEATGPAPAIDAGGTHVRLAWRYLEALLQADRHAARTLVREALARGISIGGVYRDVFRPVLHEIGRLWQINQLTVAQEHFATAVTQALMAELYPRICEGERNGFRFVGTCVEGDLHELGLRMITDVLEIDGWDTHYLGASLPAADVIDTLVAQQPDVLGISATMPYHLDHVRDLIERVQEHDELDVRILVGGYPFNLEATLWHAVGADGYARDTDEATRVARELALQPST